MASLQIVMLLIAACFKLGAGEGTLLGFGVSAAEQKQIVDLHNSVRNQIMEGTLSGQPKGVNLLQLKYDSSLANAAQEIANTTIFKHAAVSDDRFYVGQNLFAAASTASGSGIANWTSAIISSWVSEHKSYTYAKCCVSGTGHYTQVIWAKTQYVGCGFSYFKTTGKYAYNYLYVCNYGPGGNSVGSYPYETES